MRTWTAQLDEQLTMSWGAGIKTSQIAANLRKTVSSIRSRAKKLGLRRPGRHVFTEDERQLVRTNYKARGGPWCARQLGLSVTRVRSVALRMGIGDQVPRIDYEDLDRFIAKKNAAGWSDTEIAAVYRRPGRVGGMDRHTISDRRRRLGLPDQARSDRQRRKIGLKARVQCRRAGVRNLAEIRVLAYRRFAKGHGWPEDLRPRAVQILDALWQLGPMARPEIAAAIGMPWKGSRKSLVSNDPEGTYLAHLIKRGLVVALKRARKVTGRGRGHSMDVYAIPLHVERGPCEERSA